MANPLLNSKYSLEFDSNALGEHAYSPMKEATVEGGKITEHYWQVVSRERELYDLVLSDDAKTVEAFLLLFDEIQIDQRQGGVTPLHSAARLGNALMVEVLLNKRAAIDERTDDEELTALHIAAMWGHEEVVEVLLKRDADPEIRNIYKKTATQLAKANGDKDLARLIKTFGKPETSESKPFFSRLLRAKSYSKL